MLTPEENKGLRAALVSVLIYAAVLLIMCIPTDGWLRDPESGGLVIAAAPLMKGLPFFIALLFFIPGVAYGFKSGTFKRSNDLIEAMGNAMADMGPFVALCFVMAQFLKYFEWSNLAIILAIKGAVLLQNSGLPALAIMILFIFLCGFLNLFVGSASANGDSCHRYLCPCSCCSGIIRLSRRCVSGSEMRPVTRSPRRMHISECCWCCAKIR